MMRLLLSTMVCLCLNLWVIGQPCSGHINSFPYIENFETDNGGWTPGGTASDWTWGHPIKTIIDAAANGVNCWITGGLSNSSYNSGENSWLMSPCFDFSTLVHPEISLNVFWETERRFDGASLEYSIDDGNSWTLLGSANTNNCDINNWYNTASVTYLGGTMGWSGSIRPDNGSCLGGDGLGRWAAAKHPLQMLAGQPSVRFRFRFGAGTQCNTYDGFAVDDVVIREAEAPAVTINWACNSDRTISFTTNSTCISSYQWNFGDPASGASNTSVSSAPTHQFSGIGEYTVTLVAGFASGISITRTTPVVVIDATKTITWPGACSNTANATFTVNPTGSNTPYFYYWETSPPQTTQSITNQGPGNVSVVISTENACGLRLQFGLATSAPITVNPTITHAACNNNNGAISTNVTGGFPPYQYQWSGGEITPSINNLAPGNYQLIITDDFGCVANGGPYTISNSNNDLALNLGPDRDLCPGQSLVLSAGTFAAYSWQDGSMDPSYTVRGAGTYYVEVIDAQGCQATDTIKISAECRDIYFPAAFTPNGDTKNDQFGPLGNVLGLEKFSLHIFNRYGELVFSSSNPLQKWDGTYKGNLPQTGSFVWMASYLLNGKPTSVKGTILLIR